jgi:hypothetical protein
LLEKLKNNKQKPTLDKEVELKNSIGDSNYYSKVNEVFDYKPLYTVNKDGQKSYLKQKPEDYSKNFQTVKNDIVFDTKNKKYLKRLSTGYYTQPSIGEIKRALK